MDENINTQIANRFNENLSPSLNDLSWLEVSEWLNLAAFLGTADSEVHIVHISHVITAYTLESLSSLT